jgi:hypothetical protein
MGNIRDKFSIFKTTGLLNCLVYNPKRDVVMIIDDSITDLSYLTDVELLELEKSFINHKLGYNYDMKSLLHIREKANEILTK